MSTITVEQRDVPMLRSVALADFSCFAEGAQEYELEQDIADHCDMVEDAAGALNVLGWEKPATTTCEIRLVHPQTWSASLMDRAEGALRHLDVVELESCVRLLLQVEQGTANE